MDDSDIIHSSGSARYGNFVNYYNFQSAENRIRLFPNFMKYVNITHGNILCLDVGCNTGELTHTLQEHVIKSATAELGDNGLLNCHILGLDLDQNLIDRANSANQNKCITFFCVDVLTENFKQICDQYLKKHNKKVFDIVYCFSVTMWIHLNHGDEGLKQFIHRLGEIANLLVIEPQPWKCYGRAVRRMKRNNSKPFEEFKNLTIRKEVEAYIDSFVIKNCNFVKVLQTAPTTWGRQINFYKKR